jgi:precorrin-2 methylase
VPATATASKSSKELSMKIVKQHMEIQRLKEELEQAVQDKLELENEVKSRNEEIYQMNEKMIMNEINSSMTMATGGEQ